MLSFPHQRMACLSHPSWNVFPGTGWDRYFWKQQRSQVLLVSWPGQHVSIDRSDCLDAWQACIYKQTWASMDVLQPSLCQWVSLKISCKRFYLFIFFPKGGGGWQENLNIKKSILGLIFDPKPCFESFLWSNNGNEIRARHLVPSNYLSGLTLAVNSW